jgi:CheY-like chemotaxis protein
VLIIEDDGAFASILRDLAHELNFQCVIASGAEDGLQLARQYEPVAILLDIGLPDHSGLTVLELLKREPSTRHIPIHVISVHDYQQVAREMGAIGYALKPIEREALLETFRTLDAHLQREARRLLLLEDDPVQREAVAKLLANEGVEITSASTAEEALACLRSTTFDCMVLDLMLPGESGFDLLGKLGKEEASHPPVIVYTARALTGEEEQRLRQHAKSIIVMGARSPERLLEEVTLFLHQVEAELPPEKRRMLRSVRNREAVFEGRRILLVEDDVRNIFALTSSLEPKGAIVEVARNGREAIERLGEDPPIDLVLMDVMMPEMDGLSATRELRKDPRWAELPIIALTAKAMPDDRQACLEAGANDYIAKPIHLEKLLSMVRVWMPR